MPFEATESDMSLAESELQLCRRLAGVGAELTPAMAAAARRHRVHRLLAASLKSDERATAEGARLARDLTVAAALDGWRGEETRRLLADLHAARVDVLVLKGTALAHTV